MCGSAPTISDVNMSDSATDRDGHLTLSVPIKWEADESLVDLTQCPLGIFLGRILRDLIELGSIGIEDDLTLLVVALLGQQAPVLT